ncbi:MAG: PAS domain-containing protein, partial [Bacteroidota bacterium]
MASDPPDTTFELVHGFYLASSDAICIVDERNIVVAANPAFAAAVGRPDDKVAGTQFATYILAEDRGVVDSLMASCRAGHNDQTVTVDVASAGHAPV